MTYEIPFGVQRPTTEHQLGTGPVEVCGTSGPIFRKPATV